MGGYEDETIFGKFFRNHPKESQAIVGSLIGYYFVFEVFGANWLLELALSCGFWNGPESCGGSEWWLLLYTFMLGCVMSPGIVGGVSLAQKTSFSQMSIPERDGLAGVLTGGLWGGLIWAVLWLWSLPHAWGMMPFEHGWGWIFLWVFILLPMGFLPVLGILIDASNRIKNAGKQAIEAIEFGRRNLASGAKGDDVRELQELLNKAGDSILVDGSFGNQTQNAVKIFQTDNGLTADGIVGPITWEALNESMEPDWVAGGGVSLALSQENFGTHENIEVFFKNGPGNPTDWIGIYQSNHPIDESHHYGNWLYVNGDKIASHGFREGQITIPHKLNPGNYKVAFLANNSYQLLATKDFEISFGHPSLNEEGAAVEAEGEAASTSETYEATATKIEESKEQEIAALAEAVEEISIDPNFEGEISNLRVLAEEEMEGQIKNLPAPIQNKIRAGFAAKMDAVEEKARSKIPQANRLAAGVGVTAGAVGAAAGLAAVAGVSERAEVIMEDGEVDLDEIQDQVRDLVEGMDIGEPEFDDEIEDMEASTEISEPEEETPVVETPQPATEPLSDGRGSEFVLLAERVKDALTSGERTKIVSQEMTGEWPVLVEINRVRRTMGIGLGDEYKNGKTLEGVIVGTDIAVSVLTSDKTPNLDEFEAGMTISTNCVVKEYRAVLKRFELLG